MKIEGILWLREVVDKLYFKHHVETDEVEQLFNNRPKIRFLKKGDRQDENVYLALGQSDAGRYLAVIFIYKRTKDALILSARDMAKREKKQYDKK
ncbi:MAG: BrnT family toxin [bacterium]